MFNISFYRWPDSNLRPLESEVTALLTEPQPLPIRNKLNVHMKWIKDFSEIKSGFVWFHEIGNLRNRKNRNGWTNLKDTGSGSGSVDKVVTSNSRDLWFESSHWQTSLIINCIWAVLKRRKEKRPWMIQLKTVWLNTKIWYCFVRTIFFSQSKFCKFREGSKSLKIFILYLVGNVYFQTL